MGSRNWQTERRRKELEEKGRKGVGNGVRDMEKKEGARRDSSQECKRRIGRVKKEREEKKRKERERGKGSRDG